MGPSVPAAQLHSGAGAVLHSTLAASPSAVESRAFVQRPPRLHLQVLLMLLAGCHHPLPPFQLPLCSFCMCLQVRQAGLMGMLPDQEARAVCPEGADLSEAYQPRGHARGAASAAGAALPPHSPGAPS